MLVCGWSDNYKRCEWRNQAIQRKDEVRVWHDRPWNPTFLGFEFMHTQKGIFLHQRKYTGEVLKHFNMENCNTTPIPMMPNLKLTEELDEKLVDATLFK